MPISSGKTVDVICSCRNADMTIQTIRQCRSEESFNSVWQILLVMGLKIKRWLTSSQFELREAWALWETPSRSLQDFVGDHVQRQRQLISESHHRMNTYYASIDMVLTELQPRFREKEQEIICALGNICYSEISVTVKHLMKKASFVLLNFTKSTTKFWKPSRTCMRVCDVCAD